MHDLRRKVANSARRALGTERLRQEVEELRAELRQMRESCSVSTGGTDLTAAKLAQLVLVNQWRDQRNRGLTLPQLEDVEFRAFSQNGEDGLLLYVFALLGMGDRRCVEICAGDGIQCNTANLIINHGWQGLLVDADETLIRQGRDYYARHPDTFIFPPTFANAWITRENVNELLKSHGFDRSVDLLSLDLDGVDYWIWESIEAIRPRVVIAEVQCLWGADRSVTVPYSPEFRAQFVDGLGIYSGASLPAFVNLARRKGYRLVGVQRLGFNAVFVADGLGEDVLPEVPASSCVDLPFVEWARRTLLPRVRDLDWVEV